REPASRGRVGLPLSRWKGVRWERGTEGVRSSKNPGSVLSHQIVAHQRDRRASDRQEEVVEIPPSRPAPTRGAPVVAQPAEDQLAQGVVEIARVESAARRLLA